MKTRLFTLSTLIAMNLLVASPVAWSHPGHGEVSSTASGFSLWHYATQPMHCLPILAIAVLLVLVNKRRRHAVHSTTANSV